MLLSLHIENIAIIEKCDVDFFSGFNVITGETGAGKSIIIDSINLLLGNKSSKNLIRTGSKYALVSAVFCDFNEEQRELLSGYDIHPDQDGNVVISRRISIDGKNLTKINGVAASVSLLKDISVLLVDIHGQQDGAYILNSASHINYLDEYCDNHDLLVDYCDKYQQVKQIRERITALTQKSEQKAELSLILESKIKELEKADIHIGELEKLKTAAKYAHNKAEIESSLNNCNELLNGDEVGILSNLQSLYNEISPLVSSFSEFEAIVKTLDRINIELADISDTVIKKHSDYDELEYSPEQLEQRIYTISSIVKKYGDEQGAISSLQRFKEELTALEDNESEIENATAEYKNALQELESSASKLSEKRQLYAKKLSNEITKQLFELDMPNISFSVNIDRNINSRGGNKYTVTGFDKVEFLISANSGEELKPLSKIASGGELSRVMLCLKTILSGSRTECQTLIYDEVDSGVSGSTAEKIGIKLKNSAKDKQVFSITHLAQIAALADSHYKVEKHDVDGKTVSSIKLLSESERVDEVARIMGGVDISEQLIKTARELINNSKIC